MKPSVVPCAVCGAENSLSQTHCRICGTSLPGYTPTWLLNAAAPVFSPDGKLLKQRYRLMFVAGKGGMGTVYIGKDTQLGNRLVAIKEMSQYGLSTSERSEAAENFQREAHLLAKLQHPNLPSIFDHFEENRRWYLVMSFIKGQTLKSYLDAQGGKLPIDEVLDIGIVLCNVLTYLHTHQPPIIFRDLKPSNIMRAENGHIYLIDFGIARFFKPGQAKDTASHGSVGYAPPEQYGRVQTTPRSDIYSLGATLYHLLSGYDPIQTPFHLPPLLTLLPTAPPLLGSLISSMLALDERKRPESAAQVGQELQNIAHRFNSTLPLPTVTAPPRVRTSPFKKQRNVRAALVTIGSLLILTACYLVIGNFTLFDRNSPSGVVSTFCNAMNSPTPDFQSAYDQFSSKYQRTHSLESFQAYFQRTTQCVVASPPDGHNLAGINITMRCLHPPGGPPPFNGTPGGPPPGGPPPGGPPPGGPPPSHSPIDLTLIKDGGNGWKIDTLYVTSNDCGGQSNAPQPPQP